MKVILRTETGVPRGLYGCLTYLIPVDGGVKVAYFHRSNKRVLLRRLLREYTSDAESRVALSDMPIIVEDRQFSVPDSIWKCVVELESLPSVPSVDAAKLRTPAEIMEYVSIRKLLG